MKLHLLLRKTAARVLSLGVASAACFAGPVAFGVPLTTNDAIKIDFSTAGDANGGSLADWNQVHTGLNTTGISAGSVKRHGGGTLDGVGITFANVQGGSFNNDGASANWGGTAADPYYVLGADDIYFHGSTNDFSTTITGLDPNRDYNVRIYSLIGNNAGSTERFIVSNGALLETVDVTRGTRWNAATLEAGGTVFENVRLNGAGNLVITVDNVSSVFYPLNAIVIEANQSFIPEPATMSLLALASVGMLRRRRVCV